MTWTNIKHDNLVLEFSNIIDSNALWENYCLFILSEYIGLFKHFILEYSIFVAKTIRLSKLFWSIYDQFALQMFLKAAMATLITGQVMAFLLQVRF